MKANDIRESFLEYFKQKNHTFVPSASLIPVGDQTILFTIAGMAQFKDALQGIEKRPYTRATNWQKCIRAADLDDVGTNGRHHTFFEMMGVWSFGDYYKEDAIKWSYDFVTNVIKIDKEKIWVTTHKNDTESEQIWLKNNMPQERIIKLGDEDNFWAMGPTGPCGYCSEIYVDQGIEVAKATDCPDLEACQPGCDCDRYLEIWNSVFMQFDRQESGELKELPLKSVDVGAGLERLAIAAQGKTSSFKTDLFTGIRKQILSQSGLEETRLDDTQQVALNVVSDHIRAIVFSIADGINLSNEGRGYVVRRILRRSVLQAHRLAPDFPKQQSFLAPLVEILVQQMKDYYPELEKEQARIVKAVEAEEARFKKTLASGIEKFESIVKKTKKAGEKKISGDEAFALHDSFGFPIDLTRILSEERGIGIDEAGFKAAMAKQKEKSRAEAKFYDFEKDDSPWVSFHDVSQDHALNFSGYQLPEGQVCHTDGCRYAFIEVPKENIAKVRQLKNGDLELVMANSPFYPEGGGQVADSGFVVTKNETPITFEVLDVRKNSHAIIQLLRSDKVQEEKLSSQAIQSLFGNGLTVEIDTEKRAASARHHTATHLLHQALRTILGDHVRQAGSYVSPDILRFDFSHDSALSFQEITRIEALVNETVLQGSALLVHDSVPMGKAKSMGALAMFDEKYSDNVRVVEVPHFSMELCGGTHVAHTGEIGLFKIINETSVTAGVRRIEAVAGMKALELTDNLQQTQAALAKSLKSSPQQVVQKVDSLKDKVKQLEKEKESLKSQMVNLQLGKYVDSSKTLAPKGEQVKLVAAEISASDNKEFELFADSLKVKGIDIVFIAGQVAGKGMALCSLSNKVREKLPELKAGDILKEFCVAHGGRGGGKPQFAKGGFPFSENTKLKFEIVEKKVNEIG